jgi:hypothetical protein
MQDGMRQFAGEVRESEGSGECRGSMDDRDAIR